MSTIKERIQSTPFYGGNAPFVESLYEDWLDDPGSVPDVWRRYFARLGRRGDEPRHPIEAALADRARQPRVAICGGTRDAAAQRLLEAWRLLGHLQADLDPLGLKHHGRRRELDPTDYGLGGDEWDQPVQTDWGGHLARRPLGQLLHALPEVYAGHRAVEFAHISDPAERHWLQEQVETDVDPHALTDAERLIVLAELVAADGIERYLHRRYVGQKRFSLEGGDALIPVLNDLIRRAGATGVKEVVIGMAHRGRLNVLVNVLGKSPRDLFSEFEGNHGDNGSTNATGDVKYHLGYSSDVKAGEGQTHLVLAFNPSHLEAVDPVVEGSVRARQDRGGAGARERVLPVLIHGDASLTGQGVVLETLEMSQTRGYGTGGTVHIVVNNQIGFTTSDPRDARSSRHCTDVAKMIEAPVFHVNGDDPEAALGAIRCAYDYRRRFAKDVFVEIVCYRRQGHNEADEPAVTQPPMYSVIRTHPTPREIYARRLIEAGIITAEKVNALVDAYRTGLDEGRVLETATLERVQGNFKGSDWRPYIGRSWDQPATTGVPLERLRALGEKLVQLPENFKVHNRAARILEERRKMIAGKIPLDWGCAENLAYASLLAEGYPVRLAGQDSQRGTFFHRHAVYHELETGTEWVPLNHLADDQAFFTGYNSLLSEEAAVGFEYGYATARPNSLVLWEAQYGDFANNAQVMFDQFISSGEAKWGRLCGLVLLLPHGHEGAGPEHSSARLERFLQLCAGNNMQVCVPTSASQIFHLLRRQVIRPYRSPLVVMTPKSLLRHKLAACALEDLSMAGYQLIIPETRRLDPQRVRRVVFCSGKVYFDLLARCEEEGLDQVALVRIEQLYPFPREAYAAELKRYRGATEIIWCQEEPTNQGAWYQIRHHLQKPLQQRRVLSYAGRRPMAAPASGYPQRHRAEQNALVEEALGLSERDHVQSKTTFMESK